MHRHVLLLFLLPMAGFGQIDPPRAAEAFNYAKTLRSSPGGGRGCHFADELAQQVANEVA